MNGAPVKRTDEHYKLITEFLKREGKGSMVTKITSRDWDYFEEDVIFEGDVFARNGFNDFKAGAVGKWKFLGRFYVFCQFDKSGRLTHCNGGPVVKA